MASELIKHVSDASFEADVLQPGTPVLVDYWAEWCGPCKMIAPILDEVAGAYQGKLQIAKMNVDENREIPAKFGIRGIPTLMLFKNGQLAATKVGAMSKAQLTAFIDQQLACCADAARRLGRRPLFLCERNAMAGIAQQPRIPAFFSCHNFARSPACTHWQPARDLPGAPGLSTAAPVAPAPLPQDTYLLRQGVFPCT